MATILYKGTDTCVVEADRVKDLLKNGWSVDKKPVVESTDKSKTSSKK